MSVYSVSSEVPGGPSVMREDEQLLVNELEEGQYSPDHLFSVVNCALEKGEVDGAARFVTTANWYGFAGYKAEAITKVAKCYINQNNFQ